MYPNLKLEIWKAGIRQNRLARELHIHETVLSKIINGFREPSPEIRAKLAEYFGKPEGWLFESRRSAVRGDGAGQNQKVKQL